jgi:hypothetical protein
LSALSLNGPIYDAAVSGGGVLVSTVVSDYGQDNIENGSEAIGTMLLAGGTEYVVSGGIRSTPRSSSAEDLSGPGGVIRGGDITPVIGLASGTTVLGGVTLILGWCGSGIGTILSGGRGERSTRMLVWRDCAPRPCARTEFATTKAGVQISIEGWVGLRSKRAPLRCLKDAEQHA